MAELTLTISTAQGQHRFAVLVDALKDLSPVLKEFDKYKRAKLDALFASGGNGLWPARSERQEQRMSKRVEERIKEAPRSLIRKLTRELKRARSNHHRFIAKTSLSQLLGAKRRTNASRSNTVARRAAVLAEFERQVESGSLNVAAFENEDRRLQKSVRGLADRFDRAKDRAKKSGAPLGNLPRTFRSTIKKGTLTIDSSWDSPAVRALNDGATVGGGAVIEPHPFFFWDDEDVAQLKDLFRTRAMLAAG